MFTGIVQTKRQIKSVKNLIGLKKFKIDFDQRLLKNLKKGASVAVDGVCLTVTNIDKNLVSFDLMNETLNKTTLGNFKKGNLVNIERSFKVNDEIGGHRVSGHVSGIVQIIKIEKSPNNIKMVFKIDKYFMKYIFQKGFISLNGCSLTIVDVDREANAFSINFIPETLKVTTFGNKMVGDLVNLEIENQTQIIVDTVERIIGH